MMVESAVFLLLQKHLPSLSSLVSPSAAQPYGVFPFNASPLSSSTGFTEDGIVRPSVITHSLVWNGNFISPTLKLISE